MKHLMKTAAAFAVAAAIAGCAPASTEAPAPTPATEAPKPVPIRYGDNAAASGAFEHDGAKLYYETYGEGDPLLIIHGNGGSIGAMGAQIDFFKSHFHVIAMDSREQGKSTGSDARITYEQMTDDLAALLDELKTGPVNVLGWSDGGIEALLLGIRHPDKVKKLVAMAANLNPSTDAVQPEIIKMVKESIAAAPAGFADTPEGRRQLKLSDLMLNQPHIDSKALGKIEAPVLVLAGDTDVIRTEHTVAIFNALPNAELGIFPNSTHAIPYDDPALFNATVDRFLTTPFGKKDRVGDLMASLGKMEAELQAQRQEKPPAP
jgi:pimeloyl-ACP methyl ester carboxylesterase